MNRRSARNRHRRPLVVPFTINADALREMFGPRAVLGDDGRSFTIETPADARVFRVGMAIVRDE